MQSKSWPDQVFSGRYGVCHVQGIATDGAYFYISFTTMLLKIDLRGNPVGSVTGLTGHLGCIASAPDGTVIGSLEYKQDAIGRGILAALGKTERREDAFFVARFDTGRIDRMNMDAQTDGVMQLARLTDVCEDYAASVENDGRTAAAASTASPACRIRRANHLCWWLTASTATKREPTTTGRSWRAIRGRN